MKYSYLALVLACLTLVEADLASYNYHNYTQLTNFMSTLAAMYPNNAYLYSIGQTVQGRQLWVMAISSVNPKNHVLLRPEAKLIGNMHGNEVPSKEVLIHLLEYMLANQATDPQVSFLMKNTRLHILPSLNPDGFEKSQVGDCSSVTGRYNANGVDLNRNFPDLFEATRDAPVQPETQAVMTWLDQSPFQFVVSANGHEGSLVVNYPYDNYAGASTSALAKANPSADNDVFFYMANNYSRSNPEMQQPEDCTVGEPSFVDGTTNGAAWYPVKGGMQDYNYWKHGTMEVTLELGCCKYPTPNDLQRVFNENKQSLFDYVKFANRGVRGLVRFADGTPAQYLTVQVDTRAPAFKTSPSGEYYRVLLPGSYRLQLLIGCNTRVFSGTITVPSSGIQLLEYNITLDASYLAAYKAAQSSLNKYAVFCNSNPTHSIVESVADSSLLNRSIRLSFSMHTFIGVFIIFRFL